MKATNIYLNGGRLFLLIAIVIRFFNLNLIYFYSLLGIGIVLKTLFLINGFRSGRFKMGIPFYVLFLGLFLLAISMFLKYYFAFLVIAQIVLYVAISVKILAVILIVKQTKA